MAEGRDVILTVEFKQLANQASVNTTEGFLYTNELDHPYTAYASMEAVEVDFPSGVTHDKAEQIFNNGATKLNIGGILWDEATGVEQDFVDGMANFIGEFWYFMTTTVDKGTVIQLISDYVEGFKKIYIAQTDDATIAPMLDNDRTMIVYKPDITDNPACAVLGVAMNIKLGQTFKYKVVEGVAPVTLTDAEILAIHADGAITVGEKGQTAVTEGVKYLTEGVVTSGKYLDVMVTIDLFENELSLRLFNINIEQGVIPFTQDGINLMGAVVIDLCEKYKVATVFRGYVVNVPTMADVDPTDRAERKLKTITGAVTVAGAIHDTYVDFTVIE